jgi:hypothetical protein
MSPWSLWSAPTCRRFVIPRCGLIPDPKDKTLRHDTPFERVIKINYPGQWPGREGGRGLVALPTSDHALADARATAQE